MTPEEVRQRHRSKMEWKRDERARLYERRLAQHIPANLSRRHPDHGMTIADHLVAKAEREAIHV